MFEERYAKEDAEISDLNEKLERISRKLQEAHSRKMITTGYILSELSDTDILSDERILRWLFVESEASMKAYERAKILTKPRTPKIITSGYDGREEYINYHLPVLSIAVKQHQNTSHICAEIRRWSGIFSLGRSTLVIGIHERTLSEHGAWSCEYDQVKDLAQIYLRRWGRITVEVDWTSLEVCLAFISQSLYR